MDKDTLEFQQRAFLEAEIRALFEAKCRDIMRETDDAVYLQFKTNLLRNTKKRTFKMTNSKLGKHSAEVIAFKIML